MKLIILLSWAVLIFPTALMAKSGEQKTTIYISGYVDDPDIMNDSVILSVWDHFTSESKMWNVPHRQLIAHLDYSVGFFTFKITGVTQPVYFSMGKSMFRQRLSPLLNLYLAEPGDSILMINFGGKDVSFYGQGSAKYQCRFDLDRKTLFDKQLDDSTGQMALLNKYRYRVNKKIFDIMRADIIGKYYLLKCLELTYTSLDEKHWDKMRRNIFYNSSIEDSPDVLSFSRNYTAFLLMMTRLDNQFMAFKIDQYNLLKRQYTGVLLDKLITIFFTENTNFLGDPTPELINALSIVKTPWCNEQIQYIFDSRTVGQAAFNFSLPDTRGQLVRLTDFKGKIAFIDFWFTGCQSCREYYDVCLTKAEKKYRQDTSIVFISVSIDENKEQWIKSVQSAKYTSPDAINLYTAGLGQEAPVIKYYQIQAYPTPMLIDRKGNILSTSFKLLKEDGLEALLEKIDEALVK